MRRFLFGWCGRLPGIIGRVLPAVRKEPAGYHGYVRSLTARVTHFSGLAKRLHHVSATARPSGEGSDSDCWPPVVYPLRYLFHPIQPTRSTPELVCLTPHGYATSPACRRLRFVANQATVEDPPPDFATPLPCGWMAIATHPVRHRR